MERSVCHDIYRMSDNVIPIVHKPLRACSRFQKYKELLQLKTKQHSEENSVIRIEVMVTNISLR